MKGDDLHFLEQKALGYGVALSPEQLDLFQLYLDELWDWKRRINLIGLSDRKRVVTELLLDSLIPIPHLPRKGLMLDIGSGAGFPAVPIKILSHRLKIHLLEPNSKKTSFLKQIIRLLNLTDIEVIRGRIETDRGKLSQDGYDLITSRALAEIAQIIKWCAPLLRRGGILVCFSGGQSERELEGCSQLMEEHQLELRKTLPYRLPGKGQPRTVALLIKKWVGSG